jgi:hypothetical protein
VGLEDRPGSCGGSRCLLGSELDAPLGESVATG